MDCLPSATAEQVGDTRARKRRIVQPILPSPHQPSYDWKVFSPDNGTRTSAIGPDDELDKESLGVDEAHIMYRL